MKKLLTGATLLGVSALGAFADSTDAASGLTTAVASAQTLFNSVALLSVGAITFALLVKFLRKGAK